MKKLHLFAILVAVFVIAGCAKPVHKEWAAVKGSKGDAAVTMGFTWDPNTEIPEHNYARAEEIASEKCRAWGYESAEAFGAIIQECTQMVYTGFAVQCGRMKAEAVFQCKDPVNPEPAKKTVKK